MWKVLWLALGLSVAPVVAQAQPYNNIIVITDDQSAEMFDYMPFVQTLRTTHFREFRWMFHLLSQCCPSRVSMWTGKYPQNHAVLTNNGPDGGYPKFMDLGLQNYSWTKLLHDEGHYTALLGKSLNDPPDPQVDTSYPVGWDYWFGIYDQKKSFNYWVNNNGVAQYFGFGDENYLTNVLRDRALAIIDTQAQAGIPFTIVFAPPCPHTPSTPANQYAGTAATTPFAVASQPGWNPANVADKPSFIQALPLLDQAAIDKAALYWRRGLECLRSVDDAIAAMWQKLIDTNELANTYFWLLTDNGLLRGHWRLTFTKGYAYRPSSRVPMFLAGPGVTPGVDAQNFVTIADIFPTVMETNNIPIPAWVDGRSLVPLFPGSNVAWRKSLMLRGVGGEPVPPYVNPASGLKYRSLITIPYIYTLYLANPTEREYYLRADPWQLTNLATTLPPEFTAAADALLEQLATCTGDACRTLENAPPPTVP